jgi:hypothetical protein
MGAACLPSCFFLKFFSFVKFQPRSLRLTAAAKGRPSAFPREKKWRFPSNLRELWRGMRSNHQDCGRLPQLIAGKQV